MLLVNLRLIKHGNRIMVDSILKVTLVQLDIAWENKSVNLAKVHNYISAKYMDTDVLVLPEMFSTGFTMNSKNLAETIHDETISTLKNWANEYNIAICGSFIAKDNENYYNRGFFISSDKEYYYDKHHLFRIGEEPKFFSPGDKRLVFNYKGFNICLLICYDLRFPIWSRNVDNEYDLLIYTANWPSSRNDVWNTLIKARAIENMCYVCGVNRIGKDGCGLNYDGYSKIVNAKGEKMSSICHAEDSETIILSKNELYNFRTKFPVWKDADKFEIRKN